MDTRNELLKRAEVSFTLESEKNPTYDEMKKIISEKFSKPEEQIHILHVLGHFGKRNFLVQAHVYDEMKNFESVKKLEKTRKQKKEETKQIADENKKAEEEKKKVAETEKAEEVKAKTEGNVEAKLSV